MEVLDKGGHILGKLLRRGAMWRMRALARAAMVGQDDVVVLSKVLDLRPQLAPVPPRPLIIRTGGLEGSPRSS